MLVGTATNNTRNPGSWKELKQENIQESKPSLYDYLSKCKQVSKAAYNLLIQDKEALLKYWERG